MGIFSQGCFLKCCKLPKVTIPGNSKLLKVIKKLWSLINAESSDPSCCKCQWNPRKTVVTFVRLHYLILYPSIHECQLSGLPSPEYWPNFLVLCMSPNFCDKVLHSLVDLWLLPGKLEFGVFDVFLWLNQQSFWGGRWVGSLNWCSPSCGVFRLVSLHVIM